MRTVATENTYKGGSLTDTAFSLAMIGRDEWIHLHQISTEETFEVSGKINMSDGEIRQKILKHTDGREPHEIASSDAGDVPFLSYYDILGIGVIAWVDSQDN